jgi:hypothetical protein
MAQRLGLSFGALAKRRQESRRGTRGRVRHKTHATPASPGSDLCTGTFKFAWRARHVDTTVDAARVDARATSCVKLLGPSFASILGIEEDTGCSEANYEQYS